MAGASLTTADKALKEFYIDGAREQLNNNIPFLNRVEKNTKDIEGRRAVLAPHVSRNSGVGARLEGSTLPDAGSQGYAEERIPLKYNYLRIQVTGQSIHMMKSDRGSFVRQTTSEMDRGTMDLKRDVSRQLWGTGDGVIATCGVTSNANVIVLATATTAVQMRFFHVGDRIDIGTAAAPQSIGAGLRISAVDAGNKTITVLNANGTTPTLTTSGSHFVFRKGANEANVTAELTGMQKIVAASGSLHNVDPATYDVWKSTVQSGVGSLDENKMARLVMDTQIASGSYPKLFVADDGSFRAYGNLLISLKRSNNTQRLAGGYSGLSFDAAGDPMEVVWDMDAPYGCMFAISPERIFEFRAADWEWMQEDGNVLSRVSGVDAYEATMFMYHEVATDQRNAHGLLSGITTA